MLIVRCLSSSFILFCIGGYVSVPHQRAAYLWDMLPTLERGVLDLDVDALYVMRGVRYTTFPYYQVRRVTKGNMSINIAQVK